MGTMITAVDVHDVRFPTAAAGDGSDAINRGDYSATYVELRTDDGPTGAGLTFTNGRGNEITCAAVRALAHHVGRPDARGDRRPSRSRSGARSPPTCSCAGSARRRASSTWPPGALVNAVWDLRAKLAGKPMWRLLAEMPDRGAGRLHRLPPHQRRAHPGRGATRAGEGTLGLTERLAALERDGFPSYTTSVGWLGYPDDKVRALTREAYADGWRAMKMKVGGPIDDDVRRAGIIRAEIGPDALLMMDANQVWDVDEAIANMARLAAVRPVLDRGADPRRRRARPRPHRPARCAPMPGRHRRGRRQPGHLQAAAAGRRDRRVPGRRVPGRRGQRGARRCC